MSYKMHNSAKRQRCFMCPEKPQGSCCRQHSHWTS